MKIAIFLSLLVLAIHAKKECENVIANNDNIQLTAYYNHTHSGRDYYRLILANNKPNGLANAAWLAQGISYVSLLDVQVMDFHTVAGGASGEAVISKSASAEDQCLWTVVSYRMNGKGGVLFGKLRFDRSTMVTETKRQEDESAGELAARDCDAAIAFNNPYIAAFSGQASWIQISIKNVHSATISNIAIGGGADAGSNVYIGTSLSPSSTFSLAASASTAARSMLVDCGYANTYSTDITWTYTCSGVARNQIVTIDVICQ
jgi:hypothetical protein